jgi:HK97 family phage major capsid protein
MYNPHQLSQASQEILEQMTAYHAERLQIMERDLHEKRRTKAAGEEFSLARTIRNMMNGARPELADRELLEKCSALVGRHFDPQRVFLPWKVLDRTLTVATASAAGYLVGVSYGAARDVLRGWSVTAGAGITFAEGVQGSGLSIPTVTTPPTVIARPTESTPFTESTPVLGEVALASKSLGAFVDISRQLLLQANADEFVRMILLGALGQFLDKQVLQGSGTDGELLGLFNTPGLQEQSGTSLAHAGTTTMKKLSSEAGARDEDLAFVSTPAIRQLLEIREKASGNGGFMWQGGMVADRPAFASNDCPAASMVCGPWSQVIVALFGPGITLEINPYEQTKFKAGIVEARVVIDCDMGVIRPSAFVKSESIT